MNGVIDEVPVHKDLIFISGEKQTRNYGDRVRQPSQCCVLSASVPMLCVIRF